MYFALAEASAQARQLQQRRARLADDLNDKITNRPGPMELICKNILPIPCSIRQAIEGRPGWAGRARPRCVLLTSETCRGERASSARVLLTAGRRTSDKRSQLRARLTCVITVFVSD